MGKRVEKFTPLVGMCKGWEYVRGVGRGGDMCAWLLTAYHLTCAIFRGRGRGRGRGDGRGAIAER